MSVLSQNTTSTDKGQLTKGGRPLRSGVLLVVFFGVVTTVLSQIDNRFQIAYWLAWGGLAAYVATKKSGVITIKGFCLGFSLTMAVIFIFCGTCFLLTNNFDYMSGHLVLLAKSYLMYIVGFMLAWELRQAAQWKYILVFYVAASAVYAVWVLINYFPGFSAWLSTNTYMFLSKNSFGQIAGMACLICVVYSFQKVGRARFAAGAMASFLFVVILFMQCRTSLLGVSLGIVMLLFAYKKKKVLILIAVLAVVAVAFSPTLQNALSHAFFLDKYQNADLNTMSSGRLGAWERALENASTSPVIGLGHYYVDCFYINTYANLGLIGFGLVMVVWVWRLLLNNPYLQ